YAGHPDVVETFDVVAEGRRRDRGLLGHRDVARTRAHHEDRATADAWRGLLGREMDDPGPRVLSRLGEAAAELGAHPLVGARDQEPGTARREAGADLHDLPRLLALAEDHLGDPLPGG